MERFRQWWVLQAFLCLALLIPLSPLPTRAQEGPPPPGVEVPLEDAKELIKTGDYDRAIEILKAEIARMPSRETYLLLIKAYVTQGNYLKSQPQGRELSSLNYKEARERINECLGVKELRHTRPEPGSEYPPEMIDLFARVRGEKFGSFRVMELDPRNAYVILDADTLRSLPGDTRLGDVDLAVGSHQVMVVATGYKDLRDEIVISPSSTLERPYQLQRRRTGLWYATRAAGALGVVGGIVALLAGRGGASETQPPQALPHPPAPPAK